MSSEKCMSSIHNYLILVINYFQWFGSLNYVKTVWNSDGIEEVEFPSMENVMIRMLFPSKVYFPASMLRSNEFPTISSRDAPRNERETVPSAGCNLNSLRTAYSIIRSFITCTRNRGIRRNVIKDGRETVFKSIFILDNIFQ